MAISVRSVTTDMVGGASVSVTTPSAQTGDLIVVILSSDFYDTSAFQIDSITPSVTLNAVAGLTVSNSDANIKVWWGVAGSNTTYAVQGSTGHSDEEKAIAVYLLSGADTSSPIDGTNTATFASNGNVTVPAISPSSSNAFMLVHVQQQGAGNDNVYGLPGTLSQQYSDTDGTFSRILGASRQLSASGSTGTFTITQSRTDVKWGLSVFGVKTASGGGGGNSAVAGWFRA